MLHAVVNKTESSFSKADWITNWSSFTPPGVSLGHSQRWVTFFFYRQGVPNTSQSTQSYRIRSTLFGTRRALGVRGVFFLPISKIRKETYMEASPLISIYHL